MFSEKVMYLYPALSNGTETILKYTSFSLNVLKDNTMMNQIYIKGSVTRR